MPNINVIVNDETENKFKQYANEDECKLSYVVRRALKLYSQMRDNGQLKIGISED